MKKFILALILIVFTISGCSSSSPDIESDSVSETAQSTQLDSAQLTQQKYKDITFNIPSNWEIKDIGNGYFYAYANKHDFLTILSMACEKLDDDFFNGFVDGILNDDMFETAKPCNEQKFKINSHVYYSLDADTTADKARNQYRFCATTHSGEAYMFIMCCRGDEFKYNTEIEAILESVIFKAAPKSIETKTIKYEDVTFDIPSHWKDVSEITNNLCFQIKNIDNLMVDRFEIGIPLNDDFFDTYLNLYAENDNYSNFSVEHKESKTINNKVYFIANTCFLRDDYLTSMRLCATEHKGFLYSFIITARGSNDRFLYTDELDHLLNSIKFTDNIK